MFPGEADFGGHGEGVNFLLKVVLYLTLDSKVQCWSHLSIFTVKWLL